MNVVERGEVGNKRVCKGLTRKGRAAGEGLEGLPGLIRVGGEEGVVEGGFEGGYVVRGEDLHGWIRGG